MQCMNPNEACTSVSGDTIIKMMMNSKTSTRPLVVISDEGISKGDYDEKMPGKTYLDKGGHNMSQNK